VAACPADEQRVLLHQLETGLGCVPTSSMGRLFDAVSALAGVRQVADYEAQAAVELEGVARSGGTDDPRYRFAFPGPNAGQSPLQIDSAPVIASIVSDLRAGIDAAGISTRFHSAVVDLAVECARRARVDTGLTTVALSGGVFQNSLLLGSLCNALRHNDFTVLRHHRVPPNDGGLALGQVLAAHCSDITEGSTPCA
jgi:hydrogenase maturation protein HypF